MPNRKLKRRARGQRERWREEMPACFAWVVREITPLLHRLKPPRRRSTRHLRNATIEVLEALRALLDEAIDRLRREGRASSELKRIRVEG